MLLNYLNYIEFLFDKKNRYVFFDLKVDIFFYMKKLCLCFWCESYLKKCIFDIIILINGVYLLKIKFYVILIDMYMEIYRKVLCLM